jgi:serine-type D-Ala-D-Ala carboxypeptidase (penicillin-binding protein 5/6)
VSAGPRRLCAALACAAAALLAAPAAAPAQGPPQPAIGADTAVVIDARTGETLYARRANRRHAIASTTKIMTALVAREGAELGDVFAASDYQPAPIESQIRLRRGERLTLEDLLEGLLLESANDAAIAIAEGVAGSREAFVDRMNARAQELGLDGTRFANPIGLDDPDNYSTARELALMARELMGDRALARIVDSPTARLETGARPRTVANRNRLVRLYPWVTGVKTGRTQQAGYVLVGSASRRGARVISVVTGEPSEAARDADSLALLRYGLAQFRRALVVRKGRRAAAADVRHFDGRRVALVPERSASLLIRRGERVERRVEAPDELEGPLPRGERVGTLAVTYRDRVVRRVPLVTAAPVPEANAWRKLTGSAAAGAAAIAFLALAALAALALTRAGRAGRRRTAAGPRGGRRR